MVAIWPLAVGGAVCANGDNCRVCVCCCMCYMCVRALSQLSDSINTGSRNQPIGTMCDISKFAKSVSQPFITTSFLSVVLQLNGETERRCGYRAEGL
jgi:hypothetical protein